MGLIGLGPSLLVMGVLFACAWRRMDKDSDLEPVLLGLAGALLGVIVGGLVDHYVFNLDFPHSVWPFCLCAALTVVNLRVSEEAGAKAKEPGADQKVSWLEVAL